MVLICANVYYILELKGFFFRISHYMLFWLWYKIIYMGKLEYFTNLTELIKAILGEDSPYSPWSPMQHVWHICQHLPPFCDPNVGKYSGAMEHMGKYIYI